MAVPWRAALRGGCCFRTRGASALLAPELRLLQLLRELEFFIIYLFMYLSRWTLAPVRVKIELFWKGGKKNHSAFLAWLSVNVKLQRGVREGFSGRKRNTAAQNRY